MEKKELIVRENILGSNKKVAQEIRAKLSGRGVLCVNLMSAPGAGKTSLLEKMAEKLAPAHAMAVIEGDVETERDAERIRAKGIPAWQIVTGGECHLEARMIGKLFGGLPEKLDFLFIENIGNLICPASFDLGEHLRCVLVSSPEGDDKVKKYPEAFLTSDCLLITKSDLIPHLIFDPERVKKEALELNPKLRIFILSSFQDQGLDDFVAFLVERRKELATGHA
jgi:hydrogenase nickel incorporation protein HypB